MALVRVLILRFKNRRFFFRFFQSFEAFSPHFQILVVVDFGDTLESGLRDRAKQAEDLVPVALRFEN